VEPKRIDWKTTATRHVIYACVAVAIIVPLLCGGSSSFTATPGPRKVYDFIESLEPGSHVLLAFDFDPSSRPELHPMAMALLRHCFKKDLIPVVMTHWPAGVGLAKDMCETAVRDAEENKQGWSKKKVSGRDYVLLGFRPGYTDLVLNMGENVKQAFSKDYYGQPTEGMEALEGITKLKDFDFFVDIAAGATVEMWIAYGTDRADLPMAAGVTAVMGPDMYPFMDSKQIVGMLGGLRGAADYEKLLEWDDSGTLGMQAQSLTHLLIIGLIVLANVRYFLRRRKGLES